VPAREPALKRLSNWVVLREILPPAFTSPEEIGHMAETMMKVD